MNNLSIRTHSTGLLKANKLKAHKLLLAAIVALLSIVIPVMSGNVPVADAAETMKVTMKDLGDPHGHTLETVRTFRQYNFTKPKGWDVLSSSKVHVAFQHSLNLLPERSSLNILLNNRILKTIRLEKSNAEPTTIDFNIPPDLLKDHNTLTFQVDQHYTYDCEDPFSAELWTTVLGDTYLQLDYDRVKVQPDLAHFPYPLMDELNNYSPTRVGYIMPGSVSDESLSAFATAVTYIGQTGSWRELDPYLATTGDLGKNNGFVVVGTPSENQAVSTVSSGFDVKLSGSQFVHPKTGEVLPEDAGVIQMVPNPRNPSQGVLVISGNGPAGVLKAARALAQKPSNALLVGRSAIVEDINTGDEYPYRAWDGFVQYSGDTFKQLGLPTLTARGITSLPLFYKLKIMPDLFMPGKSKAKVKVIYSYSSQVEEELSKLEIRLNGKSITEGIPLKPEGGRLEEFTFEVPSEELFNYNDLEFKFHLFPVKFDPCRYVTDVHLWGTIHNTSSVVLPAEMKTPLPDVGLINDGAFPFTMYQDLSQLSVVMPDAPNNAEMDLMLQSLTRIGRESASKRGIRLTAHHVASLPGDQRGSNHLIAIGQKSNNKMIADLKGKFKLLTDGNTTTLKGADKKLVDLSYDNQQGVMEEMISPWNDSRVLMTLTGETDAALQKLSEFFRDDALFATIEPGNVAVVNADGTKSVIAMKQGDARFIYPDEMRGGFAFPKWMWILVGFFAVMGLFSVIRFLFGR